MCLLLSPCLLVEPEQGTKGTIPAILLAGRPLVPMRSCLPEPTVASGHHWLSRPAADTQLSETIDSLRCPPFVPSGWGLAMDTSHSNHVPLVPVVFHRRPDAPGFPAVEPKLCLCWAEALRLSSLRESLDGDTM